MPDHYHQDPQERLKRLAELARTTLEEHAASETPATRIAGDVPLLDVIAGVVGSSPARAVAPLISYARAAQPDERGYLPWGAELVRSAMRGPARVLEGAGELLSTAGTESQEALRLTGGYGVNPDPRAADMVAEAGRAMSEAFGRVSEEIPRSPALEGRTAGDLLRNEKLRFLAAEGPGELVRMGGAIAAGAALGPPAGVAAMTGSLLAQSAGLTLKQERAKRISAGMDPAQAMDEALDVAMAQGLGEAGLEFLPALKYMRAIAKPAATAFRDTMAKRLMFPRPKPTPKGDRVDDAVANVITALRGSVPSRTRAIGGRALSGALSGAATEGFTEAAQEAWGAAVQDMVANNPRAYEDIFNRMALGGFMGSVLGGTIQGPISGSQGRRLRDLHKAVAKRNIERLRQKKKPEPLPTEPPVLEPEETLPPPAEPPSPEDDLIGPEPVEPEPDEIEGRRRVLVDEMDRRVDAATEPWHYRVYDRAFRSALTQLALNVQEGLGVEADHLMALALLERAMNTLTDATHGSPEYERGTTDMERALNAIQDLRAAERIPEDAVPPPMDPDDVPPEIRDEMVEAFGDEFADLDPDDIVSTEPEPVEAEEEAIAIEPEPDAEAPAWQTREVPALRGEARDEEGRRRTAESLIFPGSGREAAMEFTVIELGDLYTSHDTELRRRPEEDYPSPIQGRDYERDKEARNRIRVNAADVKTGWLLQPTTEVGFGAPATTPSGVVVAGNERGILLKRMYRDRPERAEQYKAELLEKATQYGFTAEEAERIGSMQQPVLVRMIRDEGLDLRDEATLRALNTESDEAAQKGKDVKSEANTRARILWDNPQLINQLADTIGEVQADETITQYLGRAAGKEFWTELVRAGVFPQSKISQFVNEYGEPNSQAKEAIKEMLMLAALRSGAAARAVPYAMDRKMRLSWPFVLRAAYAHADWDLAPLLNEVAQLWGSAVRNRTSVEQAANQVFVDGSTPDPNVAAFAIHMSKTEARVLRAQFARYSRVAMGEKDMEGQESLFGAEEMGVLTPDEMFKKAFGLETGIGFERQGGEFTQESPETPPPPRTKGDDDAGQAQEGEPAGEGREGEGEAGGQAEGQAEGEARADPAEEPQGAEEEDVTFDYGSRSEADAVAAWRDHIVDGQDAPPLPPTDMVADLADALAADWERRERLAGRRPTGDEWRDKTGEFRDLLSGVEPEPEAEPDGPFPFEPTHTVATETRVPGMPHLAQGTPVRVVSERGDVVRVVTEDAVTWELPADHLAEITAEAEPEPEDPATAETGRPGRWRVWHGWGRERPSTAYGGGDPIPVLGAGRYWSFRREGAEHYGPNVDEAVVSLRNPFVIRSGQEWRALTEEAGWEFPLLTIEEAQEKRRLTGRLRDMLMERGHDGVIVWWDEGARRDIGPRGEDWRLLSKVFDSSQLMTFEGRARPPVASEPDPEPDPEPEPEPKNVAAEIEQGPRNETAQMIVAMLDAYDLSDSALERAMAAGDHFQREGDTAALDLVDADNELAVQLAILAAEQVPDEAVTVIEDLLSEGEFDGDPAALSKALTRALAQVETPGDGVGSQVEEHLIGPGAETDATEAKPPRPAPVAAALAEEVPGLAEHGVHSAEQLLDTREGRRLAGLLDDTLGMVKPQAQDLLARAMEQGLSGEGPINDGHLLWPAVQALRGDPQAAYSQMEAWLLRVGPILFRDPPTSGRPSRVHGRPPDFWDTAGEQLAEKDKAEAEMSAEELKRARIQALIDLRKRRKEAAEAKPKPKPKAEGVLKSPEKEDTPEPAPAPTGEAELALAQALLDERSGEYLFSDQDMLFRGQWIAVTVKRGTRDFMFGQVYIQIMGPQEVTQPLLDQLETIPDAPAYAYATAANFARILERTTLPNGAHRNLAAAAEVLQRIRDRKPVRLDMGTPQPRHIRMAEDGYNIVTEDGYDLPGFGRTPPVRTIAGMAEVLTVAPLWSDERAEAEKGTAQMVEDFVTAGDKVRIEHPVGPTLYLSNPPKSVRNNWSTPFMYITLAGPQGEYRPFSRTGAAGKFAQLGPRLREIMPTNTIRRRRQHVIVHLSDLRLFLRHYIAENLTNFDGNPDGDEETTADPGYEPWLEEPDASRYHIRWEADLPEGSRSPHPRAVGVTRGQAAVPLPPVTTGIWHEENDRRWGDPSPDLNLSDEQVHVGRMGTSRWRRGLGFIGAIGTGFGKTRIFAFLTMEAIAGDPEADPRVEGEVVTTENVPFSARLAGQRVVKTADDRAAGTHIPKGTRLRVIETLDDRFYHAELLEDIPGFEKGSRVGVAVESVSEGARDAPGTGAQNILYVTDNATLALAYEDQMHQLYGRDKFNIVNLQRGDPAPDDGKPNIYIATARSTGKLPDWFKDLENRVDAVLVDEAHNFKNMSSGRGRALQRLTFHAKQRGAKFAYLTATPASTFSDLMYMSGVGDWGVGRGSDFVEWAMSPQSQRGPQPTEDRDPTGESEAGGQVKEDELNTHVTPAWTEQLVRELRASGAYFAASLTTEYSLERLGVSTPDDPDFQAQIAARDRQASFFRGLAGLHDEAKAWGWRPDMRMLRGAIQSYVKDWLANLKLESIAARIRADLDAGKKVVIAVNKVTGDPGSRAETDRAYHANPYVNLAITSLASRDNAQSRAMKEELAQQAEGLFARILPAAEALEDLGFTADEIAPLVGKYKGEVITAEERREIMHEFQGGPKRIAVISDAGKQGIDLHDVDGHQRVLYVLDYDWDAVKLKQSMGRVDRTGQRSEPEGALVETGLADEVRFAATVLARSEGVGSASMGEADAIGTEGLKGFDMRGVEAAQAFRIIFDTRLSQEERNLFIHPRLAGRRRLPPRPPLVKQIMLDLLAMPHDAAQNIAGQWMEMTRRLAQRAKTQRRTGRIIDRQELMPDGELTMTSVRDNRGDRYAIVEGRVIRHLDTLAQERPGWGGGPFVAFTENNSGATITGMKLEPAHARRLARTFQLTWAEAHARRTRGDGSVAARPATAERRALGGRQVQVTERRAPAARRHGGSPIVMDFAEALVNATKAAGLAAPIAWGRIRSKIKLGFYRFGPHWIRVKSRYDMPTAAHEAGHALDDLMFGVTANHYAGRGETYPGVLTTRGRDMPGSPEQVPNPLRQRIYNELIELGRSIYGDDEPHNGYASEGVAEFVSLYVTNPGEAVRKAAAFAHHFEAVLAEHAPKVQEYLDEAKRLYRQMRPRAGREQDTPTKAESDAEVDAHIISPDQERRRRRSEEFRRLFSARWWRFWLSDRAAHLRHFTRPLKTGRARDPAAYFDRTFSTASEKARQFIDGAAINLAGDTVGKPLTKILADAHDAGISQADATRFVIARRTVFEHDEAKRRKRRIRETGMPIEIARARMKMIAGLGEDMVAAYARLADEMDYFWDSVLSYVAEHSQEMAWLVKLIRESDPGAYIPLQRFIEDSAALHSPKEGSAAPAARKGSDRILRDALSSRVVFQTISMWFETAITSGFNERLIQLAGLPGTQGRVKQVARKVIPFRSRVGEALAEIRRAVRDEPRARGWQLDWTHDVDKDAEIPPETLALLLSRPIEFWRAQRRPSGPEYSIFYTHGDGMTREYQIDPELHKPLVAMNAPRVRNIIAVAFLVAPNKLWKTMTTALRVSFIVPALVRDSIQPYLTSEVPWLKLAKNQARVYVKDAPGGTGGMAAGAIATTATSLAIAGMLPHWFILLGAATAGGLAGTVLQKAVGYVGKTGEKARRAGVMGMGTRLSDARMQVRMEMADKWRAVRAPAPGTPAAERLLTFFGVAARSAVEILLEAGAMFEQLPRLAAMAARFEADTGERLDTLGRDEGIDDPALRARMEETFRETNINFSRYGHWMRVARHMTGFLNANIQGLEHTLRAARRRPGRLSAGLGVLLGLGLLAYLLLDEEEKEARRALPWSDRLRFINIPKKGVGKDGADEVIRVSMPAMFWGPVALTIEMIDQMDADADTPEGFGSALALSYLAGQVPAGFPFHPLANTAIEWIGNRDVWGNVVEPQSLQRFSPEDRYTEWTSETFKWLGKRTGISPVKLEQAMRSAIGGVSGDLVRSIESVIEQAQAGEVSSPEASDVPGSGRAFAKPGGMWGRMASPAVERAWKESGEILYTDRTWRQLPGRTLVPREHIPPRKAARQWQEAYSNLAAAHRAADGQNEKGAYARQADELARLFLRLVDQGIETGPALRDFLSAAARTVRARASTFR